MTKLYPRYDCKKFNFINIPFLIMFAKIKLIKYGKGN